MDEPLVIPVHYDFASTLCYVTHRVMQRIAPRLDQSDGPNVRFAWTPIDLAALLGWRRGAPVEGPRRDNVERVMRELDVPARVPPVWLDSRPAMAAALALTSPEQQASWRERVFTAIYEEGRSCDEPDELARWAGDLGLRFDDDATRAGLEELEHRTRAAAGAMVTGVPTFMLGEWPMGGIQDDETMVSLITRFARRQRERAPSSPEGSP